MMKILTKLSPLLMAACLLVSCKTLESIDIPDILSATEPAQSDQSEEFGTEEHTNNEARPISGQELEALILDSYIIPYEYYCNGWGYDFDDPGYVHFYDSSDPLDSQLDIGALSSSFALSVLIRKLPEQYRQDALQEETDFGYSYLLSAQIKDSVGRFYFNSPLDYFEDSLYGHDFFPDGVPQNYAVGVLTDFTLNRIEPLDNGDLRVIIDRTLRDSGLPALQGEYILRPFEVNAPPPPLDALYSDGETAYRFVSVRDIPITFESQTVSISTAAELTALATLVNSGDPSYLGNTYSLEADIDLAGIDFVPIGRYVKTNIHDPSVSGFGAILEGHGNTIRNLSVHLPSSNPQNRTNAGLFDTIHRYGQVRNLNLRNVDIIAPYESSYSAGGLAGTCFGSIDHCTVSGRVDGSYQVGGMVGVAGWNSVFTNCAADMNVLGDSEIGGFAGTAHYTHILDCTARGEVTAAYNDIYDCPRGIGGFAGFSVEGTIENCTSLMQVKTNISSDWVGGFIGYNQGTITNCTYASDITANWEAVDVSYHKTPSDIKGVPASAIDLPRLK